MATVLSETRARPAQAAPQDAEHGWVVYTLLFCSACIIVGLLWDISWHMSIGRDTLWSPPHVLEQIGAGLAGLVCGFVVLKTTFAGSAVQRQRAVRFWGFRGPLGGWIAIWGAFAMIFSVPFDDWWHNAYGLDVEILSPPHIVLLCGMLAIQIGAMILALGVQNRHTVDGSNRFDIAFAFAAAAFMAMLLTGFSEFMLRPNDWRGSEAYRASAIAFPIVLVGIARAGRLRWPATIAAAFFMIVYLVPQWVIVQFPATPRLTPILNPITSMAGFGFPLVLIAPALAIDVAVRRLDTIGDWKLAGLIGVAFVTVMAAVHWPFADFLLNSPLAQNDLFLADHWGYGAQPGAWRTQFFNLDTDGQGNWSLLAFMGGLSIAAVFAALSARAGLAWGSWMRRVRR